MAKISNPFMIIVIVLMAIDRLEKVVSFLLRVPLGLNPRALQHVEYCLQEILDIASSGVSLL